MSRTAEIRKALEELKKKFGSSNSELSNILSVGRGDPSKGGRYEREICEILSRWWSHGARDDLFWRTSGSGARATTRSKRNKKTAAHYGDITYTDPLGKPLIDTFTIEIKRGYNWHHIQDVVDKLPSGKETTYEEFLREAKRKADEAGTPYWMLITRRDRRQALAFTPVQLRPSNVIRHETLGTIYFLPLIDILAQVTPEEIMEL